MRHGRKLNHLSRKSAHRKAMMANMASSLILHKRINTTLAKAKALRTYVEPLITKSKLSVTTKTSKEEATHLRRLVFSYLQNKEAVTELFREISAKVAEREGGYTRIIKTGARLGDNAEMCMMELVDYNENLLKDKGAADSRSKKRRRGAKKKSDESVALPAVAAAAAPEDVTAKVEADGIAQEQTTQATSEGLVDGIVESPVAESPAIETVAEGEEEAEQPEAKKTDGSDDPETDVNKKDQ